MDKVLKLHIGIHKTGSTTIQAWMDWLDAKDSLSFGYARTNRCGTSHLDLYHKFSARGDFSPWHLLREECLASNHEMTLASAEDLSRLTPSEINDILTEFPGDGVQLQVLAFLRQPASFATSLFSQLMKAGHREKYPSVESVIEGFEVRLKNLGCWVDYLGPEKVRVVPFPRFSGRGNELWDAWWEAVGVESPVSFTALPADFATLNVSPPWPVLAALARLGDGWRSRRVQRPMGDLFANRFTQKLVERLHAISGSAYDRAPVLFEPKEVEAIEEGCRPSMEALLRKLGYESPFFSHTPAPGANSDILWFTDPDHPSLPAEERALLAHLIEYGEALAAEEMARSDGIFAPGWIG